MKIFKSMTYVGSLQGSGVQLQSGGEVCTEQIFRQVCNKCPSINYIHPCIQASAIALPVQVSKTSGLPFHANHLLIFLFSPENWVQNFIQNISFRVSECNFKHYFQKKKVKKVKCLLYLNYIN